MDHPPTPATAGRLYDRIWRESPHGDVPHFYEWVLERMAPAAGDRLADVGCGAGGLLVAAARAGLVATGIDISREALGMARARATGARLVLADGGALPFSDGAFRRVTNLGNLEHFTSLEAGIREMRRVLSDNGEAWVLLPNLFYSGALWRVIRTGYGPDHHQPIDRFATMHEWRDLLTAGGLEVLEIIPYHKNKWWKRLLPRTLAWHFLYRTRRAAIPDASAALPPLGRVHTRGPHNRDRDEH